LITIHNAPEFSLILVGLKEKKCHNPFLTYCVCGHNKYLSFQVAIDDIFGFMYLAAFIYFVPISIIIFVYIAMLKYMKQNVVNAGVRQHIAEQNRQWRELRFIQRILILVGVLIITCFPYVFFFLLVNIGHLSLPSYGYKISFMFISFGQGMVMLITVIFTDDIKNSLLRALAQRLTFIRNTQVQNITTVDLPLQACRATATLK